MTDAQKVRTNFIGFTLPEINRTALAAGITSPNWTALEKQLAKALLDKLNEPSSPVAEQGKAGEKENVMNLTVEVNAEFTEMLKRLQARNCEINAETLQAIVAEAAQRLFVLGQSVGATYEVRS